MTGPVTITVTQLNKYVKSLLESDERLDGLLVRGEISNFICHHKSGHMYFTLKDEGASIKAVMFRSYAARIGFMPENGMSVVLFGSVSLYERDGSYQFYAVEMQPDGLGALHLAYEQLKEKLSREGLFDEARKRPLPRYPERIGIVTSEGAAALADMLNILSRRYPIATVVLCPAQVQGTGAAQSIIDAINALNEQNACDVIIIGRGGGSLEDLWAFNEETLARVIANSKIPIISAVGHETDFTIADFVADLRAPTPSAAAELIAPNLLDVRYYAAELEKRSFAILHHKLEHCALRLGSVRGRLAAPREVLQRRIQKLELLRTRLDAAMMQQLSHTQARLQYLTALVEERSPVRLLQRGYSVSSVSEATVSSVRQVSLGDRMVTRVLDGEILSTVIESREVAQWQKQ